jgi:FtsP/CotA-like multicopper oxidase with cupredoxin domain
MVILAIIATMHLAADRVSRNDRHEACFPYQQDQDDSDAEEDELKHAIPRLPSSNERREFLRQLAGGAAGVVGGPWLALGSSCGPADAEPQLDLAGEFVPDVEIAVRAVGARAQLQPGPASDVWTFQGRVVRGPADTLENVESGALGPTFRVRCGQKLRVVLDNEIPEPTIIHWHGLRVPAVMDGHPRFAIRQGQRYTYEFEVRNQAGTYWYHAHPDMRTGPQVYRGLAGLFLVEDSEEDRLLLPRGEFDIPLVIQDRSFDRGNQLLYASSPMHAMNGWLGDRVLVNGVGSYEQHVSTRAYRLRILNGSNSRIYRLAWANGAPLTIIGTDGGLLERPVQRSYVMLGPAERVELWADFGGLAIGSELALVSEAFEAGMDIGMGMSPVSGTPRQGAPLTILTVKVDSKSSERLRLPTALRPFRRDREVDAVNAAAPRRIVPTRQHMSWGMNGRSFQLDEVAPDERAKLGTLEIWDFDNSDTNMFMGGMGMGMAMPHPMHLHGGQFQVLGREGVTHAGYVDDGWKDTVLVMPGERAKILMRYSDYTGLFLYHCHNLEHEDGGMMRNFAIDA